MTVRSTNRAWYALRRTLPLWSFEENLAELRQQLPRYRVDEIIVKVDTEDFSHGQPPLAWIKAYQQKLFAIKEAMERQGIVYSVNPWITMGHCDRGRDSRSELPGLQTIVGHDGRECRSCACPLGEVWRQHIAQVWRLYAETRPAVVWVEDDIRFFNHSPAEYGCFCPEHLRRFGELVGRDVSRAELVAALVQPGPPHPWREVYLDFVGQTMIDTVAFLAQAVHSVAPETSMGLMSSGPRNHCIEGRRWAEFTQALADGCRLYSRPPLGSYSEGSLRGLYYSSESIKITRHCLSDAVEQSEVENFPFTQYSKSATFTFLQMAVSFALGCHGVTLNLFDHAGTPMEAVPEYGQMLADRKDYLNALAERAGRPGSYRGVRCLHHDRASYVKCLSEGATPLDLVEDGAFAVQMLESLGIPTTFDASPAMAASGQQLACYSEEQITTMLKGGLLLDGPAAWNLFERGFGEHLGIDSITSPRPLYDIGPFGAEEYYNTSFGGSDKTFITLTLSGSSRGAIVSIIEPAEGAAVISRAVDPDAGRHFPLLTAFENSLGGRVAIQCLDLASVSAISFTNHTRARQLQHVVGWLFDGLPPLQVRGGAYPLAFRKDTGNQSLLGLFNLTLDAWPCAELLLSASEAPARDIVRVEILTPAGQWTASKAVAIESQNDKTLIRYQEPLRFDQPLFLTVYWDA